jgi:hypothetical protein
VRHHSKNIAFPAQDAGDRAGGTIRIVHVAKCHAIFGLEFIERSFFGEILPFTVRNRKA